MPHQGSGVEAKGDEDDQRSSYWQHGKEAGNSPRHVPRGSMAVVVPSGRRLPVRRHCGMHLALNEHRPSYTDQEHNKHSVRFTMHDRQHD